VTVPPPPPQPLPGGIGGQPPGGTGRVVPGSGFPGGGFPGGGFPGGGRPDGGFPRAPLPVGMRGRSGTPDVTVARDPRTQQPVAVQLDRRGTGQGDAVQLGGNGSVRPGQEQASDTPTNGDAGSAAAAAAGRLSPAVGLDRREPGEVARGDRPFTPLLPLRSAPSGQPVTTSSAARPTVAVTRTLVPVAQPSAADPVRTATARPSLAATATPSPRPTAAARPAPDQPVRTVAPLRPGEQPVPIVRPSTGLFGLSAAPFVEGDFIAAARTADGRWAVVSPAPEGFPNAWQARVLLWFGLSLLCVAPIAWAFARRIVGPLQGFARAAEMLGRDPSAAILPLEGPAEVGRAAHAFNQMQSRLRSFVDDRTAMIGAISHDLRTPLTRLRFRIEDVPDEQHDGLLGEITAMEAMISSVIAYMRDAATPGVRERRDMAELVGDVVEDAALIGGDVRTVQAEPAPVDIDALGIRRVLDNLLTNAIKYGGGTARVALHVEDACAVADIVDDGPGIPEAEIERVFEPFYRSEAARSSQREGSGLGLAVCRSIARAHGGDVRLFRSPQGFTARVTLPLAYDGERQLAA
jgi:signal transduction histidine kinase